MKKLILLMAVLFATTCIGGGVAAAAEAGGAAEKAGGQATFNVNIPPLDGDWLWWPEDGLGLALMDRLRRCAAGRDD